MKAIVILFALCTAMSLWSQKMDRTKPPETPPVPTYRLPPTSETKLSNGLSVVLVEDKRFPLVTVRMAFQAGSKFDPQDLPGLSEATGSLLNEGTHTRSSRQIAEEMATIGGSLNTQSTPDLLVIQGGSLSEHFPKLLELVADIAKNANFPANEVQLYKQNRKQRLLEQRSQAAFLAAEKLDEVVFGQHPYARRNPTPESLEKVDRAVLAGFRDKLLAPNNAVLIAIGRLPAHEEVLKMIGQRFGEWQQKDVLSPPPAEFPEPKRQILLVDRPGSVQADIEVGRLGVTRAHPDYFPLLVANLILGGGASSRMFNHIREEKGYAYDAHSQLQPEKDAALVAAVTQVRNDVFAPALEAVIAELDGMIKAPVSSSELSDVKNFWSGVFVMRLETQNGLANQLVVVKSMGLPNDYLEKYVTRVRSVEPDQIQAVARKYMNPENSAIVVVGDAQQIGKGLEKFGKVQPAQVK